MANTMLLTAVCVTVCFYTLTGQTRAAATPACTAAAAKAMAVQGMTTSPTKAPKLTIGL